MDDLLALFDAAIPDNNNEPQPILQDDDGGTTGSIGTVEPNIEQQHQRLVTTRTLHQHKTGSVAPNNDQFGGIRMINRKISSMDLLHRMMDYPFHGTAQLCAASLSTLNTLLVEPTTILDVATVNGKTHLWTLGIVFTNSGSRIGPSGKAYCSLTIGTLTTGPIITILLFGTSYLTYCRTVRPGMVIAIINPRLLPPRTTGNNNDRVSSSSTTIRTFSITDNEQLLVVGDAQDYGRCKATISSKNENGQWIPNSKVCSNYVDKRQGDFCAHHRKQQLKMSNTSSTNTIPKGKMSSMQQLRTQAAACPTHSSSVRNMQRMDQRNGTRNGNQTNPLLDKPTNAIMSRSNLPTSMKLPVATYKAEVTIQKQRQQLPLQSLQNRYTPHQSKNPLLSDTKLSVGINKKNPLIVGSVITQSTIQKDNTINPYATRKLELHLGHSKAKLPAEPQDVTRNALRTIDILHQPQKRLSNTGSVVSRENKKRRLLNTDTSGFNGSVPIPAPAKIFTQRHGTGPNHGSINDRPQRVQSSCDPTQRTQNVLVQQHMIASQLQACQKVLVSHQPSIATQSKKSHVLPVKPKSMKETLKDNLFGSPLDEKERENIINAKSHFTSEVEAEEYARSRRVICALEEQELKAMSKANINHLDGTIQTPAIQREWYCVVCRKHFPNEPMRCKRLHHQVKFERNIRTTKSKVEERLAMTEANAEDGGLVLGTGLDWSRFPSSRFS